MSRTVHLLAYGTWLGSLVWTTFFAGIPLFSCSRWQFCMSGYALQAVIYRKKTIEVQLDRLPERGQTVLVVTHVFSYTVPVLCRYHHV